MPEAPPRTSGPTQTVREGEEWQTRRGAALAVGLAVRAVPVVVAAAASITAGRLVPRPHGPLGAGWWVMLVVVAQLVLRSTERLVQRLVPLTSLFGMSLVFPDRAPSRFAVALRMGNVERLHKDVERAVAEGLPTDLDEAVLVALSMVRLVADHDRGTRGHSERVRAYAELIGEEMGLSKAERDRLRWGALLHDVGKLTVPSEILNKAGRPTDEEWAVLQSHPAEGARIIAPLADWLGDAVHAADQHHERWDGRGYPLGLAGEQIALAARIVAVADAFAVMTAARAYKKPLPIELARREITRGAGSQFDPEVARALLRASLGRINRAAGPLAALANLPFVGTIVSGAGQVPAALASGAAAASATAVAVVAPQVALPSEWVARTPVPVVAERPAPQREASGLETWRAALEGVTALAGAPVAPDPTATDATTTTTATTVATPGGTPDEGTPAEPAHHSAPVTGPSPATSPTPTTAAATATTTLHSSPTTAPTSTAPAATTAAPTTAAPTTAAPATTAAPTDAATPTTAAAPGGGTTGGGNGNPNGGVGNGNGKGNTKAR